MASYLRPKRGKKNTAINQNLLLKKGEIFFEVPDSGVGKGEGKIKMGDGVTTYKNLPYFLQPTDASQVDVNNSTITYQDNASNIPLTILNAFVSGINLSGMMKYTRKLLGLYYDRISFIDDNAYSHNGIYRGKSLGTIASVQDVNNFVTDHNISNGHFKDIYIGDIVTINDGTYNKEWIVAGFNTELGKGRTNNRLSIHHICLIPKYELFSITSPSQVDNYFDSEMCYNTLATVDTKLKTVLGDHLKQREILVSASGNQSIWVSAYSALMTEVQIYGFPFHSSEIYNIGEGYTKLPIFNFISVAEYAHDYFSRTILNGSFCAVSTTVTTSTNQKGIRPTIILG